MDLRSHIEKYCIDEHIKAGELYYPDGTPRTCLPCPKKPFCDEVKADKWIRVCNKTAIDNDKFARRLQRKYLGYTLW